MQRFFRKNLAAKTCSRVFSPDCAPPGYGSSSRLSRSGKSSRLRVQPPTERKFLLGCGFFGPVASGKFDGLRLERPVLKVSWRKIEMSVFDITNRCNLKCIYCCRGESLNKQVDEVSTEDAVSYTHLDVYKRQVFKRTSIVRNRFSCASLLCCKYFY